jgi:hypothetical protein
VLCPDLAVGLEGCTDGVGPASSDIVWLKRTDRESSQCPLPPVGANMLRTDWTNTKNATPDWKAQADVARRDYRAAADPQARLMAADRLASLQVLRGCRTLANFAG